MGYTREMVHAYAGTIQDMRYRSSFLKHAQAIRYEGAGSQALCTAYAYELAFERAGEVLRSIALGIHDRVIEVIAAIENQKAIFAQEVKALEGKLHVVVVDFQDQRVGVVRKKVSSLLGTADPVLFLSGDLSQTVWEILGEHMEHTFESQTVEQAQSSARIGLEQPIIHTDFVTGLPEQVLRMKDPELEMVFVSFAEAMVALLVCGKQIETQAVLQLSGLFEAYHAKASEEGGVVGGNDQEGEEEVKSEE